MSNYHHEYIYLLVTQDKYELPLDFDISISRLAKRHGVHINTIRSGAYYADHEGRRSKWRKVRL